MREARTFDIVCNSLAGVPNYTRLVSFVTMHRVGASDVEDTERRSDFVSP